MLNKPSPFFFDQTEVEQMKRYLHSAEGEGTVDELGFGRLYLQLANTLFPWCSTLTTRARYFFWSSAILMIAAEEATQKYSETGEGTREITKEDTKNMKKVFSDKVRHLETYLGLALNTLSTDSKGPSGVFGKRNINQRHHLKVKDYRRKGILSLENRYPNAIYRNSMAILGLFGELDETSNSLILASEIKRQIDDEYDVFAADWRDICLNAKNEVGLVADFFEQRKEKSYQSLQVDLKKHLERNGFNGFELNPAERIFLRKKIENKSPYLKQVKWAGLKKVTSLVDLAGFLDKKNEYYDNLIFAHHVDLATAPFREIYIYIKNHAEQNILNRSLPGKVSYEEWLISYKKIIKENRYDCKEELYFMADWEAALKRSGGKVDKDLIRYVSQRATTVVQARGKMPPHLKSRDGDELNAFDEVDTVESSFRLGNALTIVRDLVG